MRKSAREYCIENGLDTESLDKQLVYAINGKVIFAQPSNQETLGLKMDIITQPKPTLVVERSQNGYIVDKTDYTSQFLSKVRQN